MVEDPTEKKKLEEITESDDFFRAKAIRAMLMKHPVAVSISTLLSVGLGISLLMPARYASETSQMRERYLQLQDQYVDTDVEINISREEKEAFDKGLFRGRGVLVSCYTSCDPEDKDALEHCRKEKSIFLPELKYSSTGAVVLPETVLKLMNECAETGAYSNSR